MPGLFIDGTNPAYGSLGKNVRRMSLAIAVLLLIVVIIIIAKRKEMSKTQKAEVPASVNAMGGIAGLLQFASFICTIVLITRM
jgi:uncharacterized membrane protein (DUF485 family)